jgi:hypothetical protein
VSDTFDLAEFFAAEFVEDGDFLRALCASAQVVSATMSMAARAARLNETLIKIYLASESDD